LLRGICVNRRQRSGVACVEKLQQIKCFLASNFPELRGEFICSWCEILEGTLLAVPYPSPKSEIRKFAHPREAEVVGRVMSVAAMPLAGPEP
jgi:hypothetical protein